MYTQDGTRRPLQAGDFICFDREGTNISCMTDQGEPLRWDQDHEGCEFLMSCVESENDFARLACLVAWGAGLVVEVAHRLPSTRPQLTRAYVLSERR